jgi:hypothetical protein
MSSPLRDNANDLQHQVDIHRGVPMAQDYSLLTRVYLWTRGA